MLQLGRLQVRKQLGRRPHLMHPALVHENHTVAGRHRHPDLSGVDFKTNRHNLFIVAVSIGLGMVLLIAPNFRQWMALNTRAFQKNADPTRVAHTLGALAYML